MGLKAFRMGFMLVLIPLVATLAYAQGGRSSLSGVVKDPDGGVLPGVTVVITDPTGTKTQTLTNNSGVVSAPAISAGTYAVTLSLSGFKTTILDKVVVVAAAPSSLLNGRTTNAARRTPTSVAAASTTPAIAASTSQ